MLTKILVLLGLIFVATPCSAKPLSESYMLMSLAFSEGVVLRGANASQRTPVGMQSEIAVGTHFPVKFCGGFDWTLESPTVVALHTGLQYWVDSVVIRTSMNLDLINLRVGFVGGFEFVGSLVDDSSWTIVVGPDIMLWSRNEIAVNLHLGVGFVF